MKKKNAIYATLFLLLIMQITPGCMMIGFHDDFVYLPHQRESTGTFIPYLYIKKNTLNIPLLLFRVDIDRLPHSFAMLQYDATYLDTDKGFKSFVLESLYIEFEDGTRVFCIEDTQPLSQREFIITNKPYQRNETHIFEGVITKRMSFTVHTIGESKKDNGQIVLFRRTTQYKYDGKDATFHTIFDEWASV
ncbi:MAG: hypothetical protein PF795_12380 [Kiritimatiellae bacterium]|jgi:hypothetical protein|nr:hypothetical protein [Kiritimatiellia bacterium]